MKFQFSNRASSHLAAPITVESTYITLSPGTGDRFPANLSDDAPAQLTLVSTTGSSEIVQAHKRAGDVIDIYRGQENSSVLAFSEGSLVELRLTAGVLNSFLPLGGGSMTGDIDLGWHALKHANMQGGAVVDYLSAQQINPPDNNFIGAIQLLNGGLQPRINTCSILTTWFLMNAIFLWWGRLDQLPAHLKLCDGTLDTPDLRNRFPMGANSDADIGEWGGQFDVLSGLAGGHNHDGATQNQTLGSFNLPGLVPPTANQTKVPVDKPGGANPTYQVVTNVTMGGGGYSSTSVHAHGINWAVDHQHPISLRPPYYKLYFVMFRSYQLN